MSEISNPEPSDDTNTKPPRRHWKATEPFWDFRASHWVEVALTAALLGVGLSQLYVYWRQAGIMKTQANTAELMASLQRAFITVSELKESPPDNTADINAPWRFTPIIKNSGSTPALDVKIIFIEPHSDWMDFPQGVFGSPQNYFHVSYEVGAPRDPDELIDNPVSGMPYFPILFSNLTIGPQAGLTASSLSSEFSFRDWEKASGNRIGRFLYGSIRYTDVFGGPHISKFCFRVDGIETGGPGTTSRILQSVCQHWNCTDQYCKQDKDAYDAAVKVAMSEFRAPQLAPPPGGWPPPPQLQPTEPQK